MVAARIARVEPSGAGYLRRSLEASSGICWKVAKYELLWKDCAQYCGTNMTLKTHGFMVDYENLL
jgi:hypothetical protein